MRGFATESMGERGSRYVYETGFAAGVISVEETNKGAGGAIVDGQ